jgi:signal transduction histidine kinase/ActR/RegA family two-component response regulator/HPt (histidine-containing phosphotransfer) domain-containing protein
MRSISIKFKVVLAVVLLTLVILLPASVLQMVLIRQDMVRMLSDQQFAATVRTAADIDARLDNERDALMRVAKGMPSSVLESSAQSFAYFAQRPGLLAAFDELWMVRPDGSFLSDLPHMAGRAPLNSGELADLARLQAHLQPIISHPARNESDGEPAIRIMAPVFTSEGRFGGALVAVVKLHNKNLLGTLVDARVGKSGVFIMVTKEPKPVFLLHPRKDMILENRPENPASETGRALHGFEGTAEGTTLLGDRCLYSYKSLKNVDWLLMAVVPLKEVYAPITLAERRLWGITFVLALAVIPLAWMLAALMLKPLLALRAVIEKLRLDASTFTPHLVQRRDEIGDLARSFYSLFGELKAASEREAAAAAREREAERRLREVAESTASAKSAFLATMSHEVRTPMSGVLGISELLLETPLTADQRDYVQTILSSGKSLLAISNDILDISKIEAGKLELEAVPLDPIRVVREVAALFGPRASAKGLTIHIDAAPDVPGDVIGDPGRLRQVLSNLLGNSLKFTAMGGIRIAVSVAEVIGDDVVLAFAVADSGIGMTAEQRAKLFQPYSQAEESTSRRFGGTGLGLSICLRLVELMAGRFEVESSPGEGSRFTFTLRCPRAETGSSRTLPSTASGPPQRFKGRVLLVDDNLVNRKVAHATLSTLGLTVIEAQDGSQALDALEVATVDLVLMDMNMPVMDGLEATRRIRAAEASEGRPRVPILAMTANVMRDAVDACRDAGMDGYVPKPFLRSEMIGALTQWLEAVPAEASQPPQPSLEPPKSDALQAGVINLAAYRRLEEAMGSEMPGLVAEFIDSTTRLIDEVSRAADRQDPDLIRSRAHVLKATAATLGADRLGSMAAGLEAAQPLSGSVNALAAIGNIEAEFALVVRALQAIAATRLASA